MKVFKRLSIATGAAALVALILPTPAYAAITKVVCGGRTDFLVIRTANGGDVRDHCYTGHGKMEVNLPNPIIVSSGNQIVTVSYFYQKDKKTEGYKGLSLKAGTVLTRADGTLPSMLRIYHIEIP